MSEHDKECGFLESGDKKDCRCEINRYKKAVFITSGILVFQLVIIWFTDNLALRADTFHVSSDLFVNIGSLVIAFICLRIAGRTENLIRTSFAVAGIILLVGGGINVIIEAHERLINPFDIGSLPVIFAGIIGAAGNYWVHRILERVKKDDRNTTHNVLSAHVLSDMICSVFVAISATIVYFSGWLEADPFMSIAIAGYIFFLSGQLVFKVMNREIQHKRQAIVLTVLAIIIIVLGWNMVNIFALTGFFAPILFLAGLRFGYKHECGHDHDHE